MLYVLLLLQTGEWMNYNIKADTTVKVKALYRVARGLKPSVMCGISMLIDVDMSTTDPSELCSANAADKVGTTLHTIIAHRACTAVIT
jgi:hypothetical protein